MYFKHQKIIIIGFFSVLNKLENNDAFKDDEADAGAAAVANVLRRLLPCSPSDPAIVNQKFWSHATGADGVREVPAASMTARAMFRRDLLWTDARDVWHCAVASV